MINFTPSAQKNIEETNCDVELDLWELRAGTQTPERLLRDCLEGADPDREQGWREYVDALVAALCPSRESGAAISGHDGQRG